jgi:hypothetical protein
MAERQAFFFAIAKCFGWRTMPPADLHSMELPRGTLIRRAYLPGNLLCPACGSLLDERGDFQ